MSNSGLPGLDAIAHRVFTAAGIADNGEYRETVPGPATPCRVYVDQAMQMMGDVGRTSGPRTVVSILRADVPDPQVGARVTVRTRAYVLEAPLETTDESMTRWVVHRAND